jgi:hypothetical protein
MSLVDLFGWGYSQLNDSYFHFPMNELAPLNFSNLPNNGTPLAAALFMSAYACSGAAIILAHAPATAVDKIFPH